MTILVLEDEPAFLTLMRGMLSGHTVLATANWDEAISAFRSAASEIDLLIADVTIPVVSGVQVARLLRGENHQLPVILTSGYPAGNWSALDTRDLGKLGTGATAILQKPFAREQLLETVQRLTGQSPAAAVV